MSSRREHMKRRNVTITFVALVSAVGVSGLAVPYVPHKFDLGYGRLQRNPFSSCLYGSSREEEIAELEEKLRQLKDSSQEEEEEETAKSVDTAQLADVKGKEMILSELELEKEDLLSGDDSGGGGNLIATILGGVALLVFTVIFAQMPVGQENLSRYSATPSAPSAMKTIDLGDLNTFQKD